MNCYSDLTTIKRRMGMASVTDWDTDLLAMLNAASRFIDDYCRRRFFVETATRYLDGAGEKLFPEDLLSVTTLKVDDNADGTFENSYTASTDYELWPYDKLPKTMILISSRADRTYTDFGVSGRKIVQIVGLWGYGNGLSATPYSASGSTADEELDATETAITTSGATGLAIGQTWLIESEQMYVSAGSSTTWTVTRGVNGTTAATHATAKTIYVYQYPEAVVEAAIMQTCEWYKLRSSGYTGILGSPEFGEQLMRKGLDPNIRLLLNTGGLVKRV